MLTLTFLPPDQPWSNTKPGAAADGLILCHFSVEVTHQQKNLNPSGLLDILDTHLQCIWPGVNSGVFWLWSDPTQDSRVALNANVRSNQSMWESEILTNFTNYYKILCWCRWTFVEISILNQRVGLTDNIPLIITSSCYLLLLHGLGLCKFFLIKMNHRPNKLTDLKTHENLFSLSCVMPMLKRYNQ